MRDSKRKCAKCGASTAQDSELVLHRFPKPGSSNVQRSVAWAKFCYPEENWNSVEFHRSLFLSHKMLCSMHFPESAFVQDHLQRKKLHRYSIPSELSTTSTHSSQIDMSIADTGSNEQPGTARASDLIDSSNVVVLTETSLTDQEPTICEPTTDILKVCRVCLAMDVKMYDLNDIELREMFQNITGIEVTENNHPILERLCWECAGRLKAAATFRNKALLSDALLQGLANTGQQIRKNDITLIKDSVDYLKTETLTAVEAFHTVDIDPENDGIPPLSENSDTEIVQNTLRKDFLKQNKENIIEEDNDQRDVEDESMIEAPINTEMEYDQYDHICPNTGEESSNVIVQTNPLFSSNIPLKEDTINSTNSSPPPSCSHVKPKYPVLAYRLKTPGDCEDKIKKHVIKITKRDSISKIVFINSKELISAKSKNINVKKGVISKKTSNLKLLKNTQVKANTPTDEESMRLEDFEF